MIATTHKQSKRLLELGIDPNTSDMYYPHFGEGVYGDTPRIGETSTFSGGEDIPCWTLSALLSVIPYNISFNKAVYRFKLVKFSTHWECYHENFGTVSTNIFKADTPIEAAFAMVVWLKENKYI